MNEERGALEGRLGGDNEWVAPSLIPGTFSAVSRFTNDTGQCRMSITSCPMAYPYTSYF
jgi:hypothetical protein